MPTFKNIYDTLIGNLPTAIANYAAIAYLPSNDTFYFTSSSALYSVKNSHGITLVNPSVPAGALKVDMLGVIYILDSLVIHVSTDGGITFTTNNLPVTINGDTSDFVKICPITNRLFCIGVGNTLYGATIHTSNNNGASWNLVYNGTGGGFGWQGWNYVGVSDYIIASGGFHICVVNVPSGLPYKMVLFTNPVSVSGLTTFTGAAVDNVGGGHGLIYASTGYRFGKLLSTVNNVDRFSLLMTTPYDVTNIVYVSPPGYVISNTYPGPLGVNLLDYNIRSFFPFLVFHQDRNYDENNNLIVTSGQPTTPINYNRKVGRYRVWRS